MLSIAQIEAMTRAARAPHRGDDASAFAPRPLR
jgi:hypothetical protein